MDHRVSDVLHDMARPAAASRLGNTACVFRVEQSGGGEVARSDVIPR